MSDIASYCHKDSLLTAHFNVAKYAKSGYDGPALRVKWLVVCHNGGG